MITIKEKTETSFSEKKSKFIGLAVRVSTEQQALLTLEQRKKQHYDATHNCYAYLLENGAMRYSDDGEPQGTAGIPMLEVLKHSGLSDVLFICTRYFGGILLGAGGLVRAYTKSAADTLQAAQRIELVPCSVYNCSFSYEMWAKGENLLKKSGFIFEDIKYSESVSFSVFVRTGYEERLLELVRNISLGQAVPEFVEKKLREI